MPEKINSKCNISIFAVQSSRKCYWELNRNINCSCFNEANRLDKTKWLEFSPDFEEIIFVNDGSSNHTMDVLRSIKEEANIINGNISIIDLKKNDSKASSIRQRVLQSAQKHYQSTLFAYCDADLSMPLTEILRLGKVADELDIDLLLSARVKLSGWNVKRSGLRHYLGRISVTLVNNLLKINIYDAQASAKVFKQQKMTNSR